MSNDYWPDEPKAVTKPSATVMPSMAHVWFERIGIGIVAVISILIPLLIGLGFYLALTDGIVVNANDPLRESRLWMVQERTGATGIGLSVTSPQGGADITRCAITYVTFLKWDRKLRFETDASYCRCYEIRNGQLVEASGTTCKP